jgi:hypothetical protein
MFWALFDKIELEEFNTKDTNFEITEQTGRILFAFYSICAIMVALNMLIAMMSHSYDYISVRITNFVRVLLYHSQPECIQVAFLRS